MLYLEAPTNIDITLLTQPLDLRALILTPGMRNAVNHSLSIENSSSCSSMPSMRDIDSVNANNEHDLAT